MNTENQKILTAQYPDVWPVNDADTEKAQALAAHLGSRVLHSREEAAQRSVWLKLDDGGLALTDGKLELTGNFTDLLPRLKQGRLQTELLVKAAKIRGAAGEPTAVDATAGMGEDSLLLAAAGFRVLLIEHDPVIAALLRDTMERAALEPELRDIISRMTLLEGDSLRELTALSYRPDVVYLDPMFPERQKSALIKKKFQLLHLLERPCGEEEELLQAALAAGPRKIIIKRPLKGPLLAGMKPGYVMKGKAVRYDCIVPPPRPEEK